MSVIKTRTEPVPALRFRGHVGFRKTITERVEAYMVANNLPARDLPGMYRKSLFMFAWWAASYAAILLAGLPLWTDAILCFSFGLASAGVGFNVMHDANHEGYSNNMRLNRVLGWSIELLGLSSFIWRQQHNIWHHTYTNISGLDEGLEAEGTMRWSPHDPWKPVFVAQHLYWPVIYALSAMSLLFIRNFKVYFAGKSGDTFRYPKMSRFDKGVFWTFRVVNAVIFFALPVVFFPWYQVLIGFALGVATAGFVMATILQLAHVMYAVEFPEPTGDPLHIENEWAVHEVQTTLDFAPNNRLLNWYVGGLNFQIEHHLFPRMCHINYPKIKPIVEQTCEEFGVTYLSYPTFKDAMSDHVRSLRWLGRSPKLDPAPFVPMVGRKTVA